MEPDSTNPARKQSTVDLAMSARVRSNSIGPVDERVMRALLVSRDSM